MKKYLLILVILSLGVFTTQAQRRSTQNKTTTIQPNIPKNTTTKTVPAKTSANQKPSKAKLTPSKVGEGYWSVGVLGHTNATFIGGISFKKAWGNNTQKLNFFQLDFVKTEDYREFNLLDPNSQISIKDGKINHLYTIRPSFGKEFTLLKKGPEGGSQLRGIISTGPSIGFLAPNYINVTSQATNFSNVTAIKMEEFYNNKSGFTQYVVNQANMFTGLPESKIQPGWHFKTGLLMEFSAERRNYMAIEAGFMVDTYFKPVPIMLENTPRNTFSAAYITFYLGKK